MYVSYLSIYVQYIHTFSYIYNKKETLKTVQIILKSNVLCSAYIRSSFVHIVQFVWNVLYSSLRDMTGRLYFRFFVVVVAFVVSRSSLLTYAPLIRLWGIMRMTVLLLLLLPQSAVWIYKKCSQLWKQLLKS